MKLIFKEADHSYISPDEPERKWLSVTGIISKFKEKFDQKAVAATVVKKKKSKWYGMHPDEVIAIWNKETNRALKMGTWYHNARENEVDACQTIQRQGVDLPIVRSLENTDYKEAPSQRLSPGIYPEHFMYLDSSTICGQADRVEVIGDTVDVYDYKTNKKIDKTSYTDWQGVSKKMYAPLNHLDDCNMNHYTIQLSIYMYMILKHNRHLKPGKIVITHIKFEIDHLDGNGYPVIATGPDGEPIVEKVTDYEVPYLEKEVIAILKTLKK